jgi:hypothetical protein
MQGKSEGHKGQNLTSQKCLNANLIQIESHFVYDPGSFSVFERVAVQMRTPRQNTSEKSPRTAINMRLAGKVKLACALLIVTTLFSLGWCRTSKMRVPNSGNSSKKRTSRLASDILPGCG